MKITRFLVQNIESPKVQNKGCTYHESSKYLLWPFAVQSFPFDPFEIQMESHFSVTSFLKVFSLSNRLQRNKMVQFRKVNAVEMTKRYVSHVDLPMGRFSIEQGKTLVGPHGTLLRHGLKIRIKDNVFGVITYHLKCTTSFVIEQFAMMGFKRASKLQKVTKVFNSSWCKIHHVILITFLGIKTYILSDTI